jgi:hypothetical protein
MSVGGNSTNVLAARMAGVKVAIDGTPAQRGLPNKVTGVAEASVLFVWHNDLRGEPALAMYFKVGDNYYSTADTTEWCERLRPMAEWMRKEIGNKLASTTGAEQIPKTDAVEIFGTTAEDEVAGDPDYEAIPKA